MSPSEQTVGTARQETSAVTDMARDRAAGVAGSAWDNAAHVGQVASSAASDVAGTAKEQVASVTDEARRQARDLVEEALAQVSDQAAQQQQRAAGGVRTLAQGLSDMAEGRGTPSGLPQELICQAGERLSALAGRLEDREPGDLLDDLRSFARQRPGLFLAGAAAAGFAVGRLVKGVAKSSEEAGGQPAHEDTAVGHRTTRYAAAGQAATGYETTGHETTGYDRAAYDPTGYGTPGYGEPATGTAGTGTVGTAYQSPPPLAPADQVADEPYLAGQERPAVVRRTGDG